MQKSFFFSVPQIPYALVILTYIFGVTFTPNLLALDTNASKFMALAALNLLAVGVLLAKREVRLELKDMSRFFHAKPGLAYAGFLVVSLLSFTQSVNITESVLHFSKLFSVFSAVFILWVIFFRDLRYIQPVVFVMALLLLFDSLSVFYGIGLFIQGKLDCISSIKTVYSNKNILASAIFVKLPFSLWLIVFGNHWQRSTGWIALTAGMLATFFMATRSFYLGLVVLSFAFLIYNAVCFFRDGNRRHLRISVFYICALLFSLLLYSWAQSNLYPALDSRYTDDVKTRLSSIQENPGENPRIESWRWTLELIKDNPVLGVGSGNWKILILKHENQESTDFKYHYKAHNDFLEKTAETGLVGGALFLMIFVFTGGNFLRSFADKDGVANHFHAGLFLAASGLACYAVDAFFNFPADRPEILLLFSIYLAVGIAASSKKNRPEDNIAGGNDAATGMQKVLQQRVKDQSARSGATPSPLPVSCFTVGTGIVLVCVFVLMGCVFWVLYGNYESSRLQRVAGQEIISGRLKTPSDFFVGKFPDIPDISAWGESISSVKARYLLEEGKNSEVIGLLENEHGNPWDSRREFLMAMAFFNKGMPEPAFHYSKKAYQLKPFFFPNIHLLATLLDQQGRQEEIFPIFKRYLEREKGNPEAWVYTATIYREAGETEKAWDLLEEAKKNHPENKLVKDHHQQVHYDKFIAPFKEAFSVAVDFYNKKRYDAALIALNAYIDDVPENPDAFRMRAFTKYYLHKYESGIDDINHFFDIHGKDPSLLNLRGVCLGIGNDIEAACLDFEAAMQMGSEKGKMNYERFCGGE